jgi:hypothetical protein
LSASARDTVVCEMFSVRAMSWIVTLAPFLDGDFGSDAAVPEISITRASVMWLSL